MESLSGDNSATDHRKPLTQIAHDHIRAIVRSGDIVIDATAGNGHDTLFLIEQVGPFGTVYCFDIQPVAIERTKERIEAFYGKSQKPIAELIPICGDHCKMSDNIRQEHQQRVACVMFNLGYLPSGDKSVITSLTSTNQAIIQAAALLAAGGCLSVLAYTGHLGGQEEADAVAAVLSELCDHDGGELKRVPEVHIPGAPILFFARLTRTN